MKKLLKVVTILEELVIRIISLVGWILILIHLLE